MLDTIKKILSINTVRKLPEVTIYFWAIKLLSTAFGESSSDLMVHQLNPVIAVMLGAAGLAVSLIIQISFKKYTAWMYWLAVVMVAVFGTMAADVIHIVLGVPYVLSTVFFAIALTIVFTVWQKVEGTLSIHSITNTRREIFYWVTVIVTFALGTAAGDMTASTLGLGYLVSGIVFSGLFIVPAIGYLKFGLNATATFWFAYILTRPLGASFADWTGRPRDLGGLGFGQASVSLVLLIFIVALIAYLSVSRKDIKN